MKNIFFLLLILNLHREALAQNRLTMVCFSGPDETHAHYSAYVEAEMNSEIHSVTVYKNFYLSRTVAGYYKVQKTESSNEKSLSLKEINAQRIILDLSLEEKSGKLLIDSDLNKYLSTHCQID